MVDGQCASNEENNVMEEGMTMFGTTAMLRNVSFEYTLSELTLELNEFAFSGKFDRLRCADPKPRPKQIPKGQGVSSAKHQSYHSAAGWGQTIFV